jgi:MYXO-CTERM domain-containing protein
MKHVLSGVAALLCTLATPAWAERRIWDPHQGGSIDEDTAPLPLVPRPRLDRVWVDVDPATITPAVNTNKIYLNNCKPNGCVIRGGANASSIDTATAQGSWPINGTRTLTPFSASDAVWNQVVACLRDVFSPFGVEITTTNPSPAPHFEIMIAGRPTDLGMDSSVGGVSPFSCQEYIPNSLVFTFQRVWGSDVEEICATAAQEVAHSWALDHSIEPSDPMTYFAYNGRRRFKDATIACGSDCVGGVSPFGSACTGTNRQIHDCSCPGLPHITRAGQNSFQRIRSLFGDGTPTPPMVTITHPMLGARVEPGFPVRVEATDDNGVAKVELYINNTKTGEVTTRPYVFNAPTTLEPGTHTVKVTAYDIHGTDASASVQVVIGEPCGKPADCPSDTDTCIGGRCVPGPGVQGGLGSPCENGTECASGQCVEEVSGAKYCVEPCTLGTDECPAGFGCVANGQGGVCWPGVGEGGGCSAGNDAGGLAMFGLGLGALLATRRRRR